MTTQPTTTKEALEPCPLCRKPLTELTNGLAYCHNLKTDSLSVDDWIAESCQLAQRSVQLPMKVWHALNSRVSAPIVAPEVDDEALRRLICPVVDEHCKDVQLPRGINGLEADLVKAIRAPASTVAPQQSDLDNLRCECGDLFSAHQKPPVGTPWDICSFPCSKCECQEFTASEQRPRGIFDAGFAAPSTLAKAAAEEILARVSVNNFREMQRFNSTETIAAIIERCLAGGE